MSDRDWIPGGPIPTTITIATVAAMTAGSLALAGVGDGESRDERINRAAERLAVDFVREGPEICDFIDEFEDSGPGTGGFIEGDPATGVGSYLSGLSEADLRAVSDRLIGELRTQCEDISR
jgi:hypothetical protein